MFLRDLRTNKLILFFIILLFSFHVSAQKKSRSLLEKEKQDNLKRIEEANKILLETKSKKDATIGQLSAIKNKITSRERLIRSITAEVELLREEIEALEGSINKQQSNIDSLKSEYSQMVIAASKMNNSIGKLTYIFSANSISQFAMRVKYFQQYSQARKEQLDKIVKLKEKLEYEKEKLRRKIIDKNNLIGVKTEETQNLNKEKEEQDKVLGELSEREKSLKKELEERRKSQKKLEKLIMDLIAAERERAIRAAKKLAEKNKLKNANNKNLKKPTDKTKTEKNDNVIELTPEARVLSNSFAGNARKLPWPVLKGSISQPFGKQPHPVLKGVFIDNLGVDIQTIRDEQVRTVFQGKVITVAEVPGMNKVVMIQHGEYFTVYAKLKNVIVKTGDEVIAKQNIGVVYTDKDDVTLLQFQIWKNNIKLDPEDWLYKK